MFLRALKITDHIGHELRSVSFRKGLNVILGVGDPKKGETTNNIGKTTLVRAIDFCLDGALKQFYADPEFKTKNKNEEVFNFLKTKKPTFCLTLCENMDFDSSQDVEIKRTVETKESKGGLKLSVKSFINGEPIYEKDLSYTLKELLFKSHQEKPAFRQLLPKFIRKEDQQISNILRFVHSHTSDKEYEKIHFILFGFKGEEALQHKHEIEVSLKKENEIKRALASNVSVTDLEQIILNNASELAGLQALRDSFRIDEKYDADEQKLTQIQERMRILENRMSDRFLESSLLNSRLEQLQKEVFVENTKGIESIYAEAKLYGINLSKKFEDTVKFNNSMLSNEIHYLNTRIDELKILQRDDESNRAVDAQNYSILLNKLSKQGSLAEYTQLNEKIESLSIKYGQNRAILEEIKSATDKISILDGLYSEVCTDIQAFEIKFKENITIFNTYFSEYSQNLYGQRYLLSYNEEEWPRKFHVIDTNGNLGSGKKQAIVAAFDLAYIKFIDEVGLPYPRFATHDKVELVDADKLSPLLQQADQLDGQYIIPIIFDKFDSLDAELKNCVVLQLSQADRFFNIEGS